MTDPTPSDLQAIRVSAITVCLPNEDARALFGEPEEGVDLIVWDGQKTAPDACAEAEFIVSPYGGALDVGRYISAFPKVQVVQLLAAGFDNWQGHISDGITLCNGRGVHTGSTAELALALILASIRELPLFVRAQDRAEWRQHSTQELLGKRALILGDGDIGQAVDRRLRAFDVDTTRVARTARDGVHGIAEVMELLPTADVVVLTVPLTDATTGLVDEPFLAAMPGGALLVNVARGAVVETDALLVELRNGRLNAALDVVDPEPLPPNHPLWSAPNVLLTPHVGGGTAHWAERGYALVRDQVRRYRTGQTLQNVVSH